MYDEITGPATSEEDMQSGAVHWINNDFFGGNMNFGTRMKMREVRDIKYPGNDNGFYLAFSKEIEPLLEKTYGDGDAPPAKIDWVSRSWCDKEMHAIHHVAH